MCKLSSGDKTRQDDELSCVKPIAGETRFWSTLFYCQVFLSFMKRIVTGVTERTMTSLPLQGPGQIFDRVHVFCGSVPIYIEVINC